MYVCNMCMYMYMYMYMCMCMCMYVCMHACMYVCMYINTCLSIYTAGIEMEFHSPKWAKYGLTAI